MTVNLLIWNKNGVRHLHFDCLHKIKYRLSIRKSHNPIFELIFGQSQLIYLSKAWRLWEFFSIQIINSFISFTIPLLMQSLVKKVTLANWLVLITSSTNSVTYRGLNRPTRLLLDRQPIVFNNTSLVSDLGFCELVSFTFPFIFIFN